MFLTIEGGEGAGKSTLIQGLKAWFEEHGQDVVVTREPGGTRLAEEMRKWLLSQTLAPQAELNLFLAARAEHLAEVIRPALAEGKVVLCDRFNDSTIAYQGYGRGLDVERVYQSCLSACEGTLPEVTLYLDLPPEIGFERIGGGGDRIEEAGTKFHQKVRQGYLMIADSEPDRVRVLDATQEPSVVLAHAIDVVDTYARV